MANLNYTYQTFLDDLVATISTHKQVNSVHTGLISDWSNPKVGNSLTKQNNITYPYVFIMNDNIQVSSNDGSSFFTANTSLIISDRYTDDETSIYQVQSNMLEIVRDIISYYGIRNGCGKPYRIMFDNAKFNINLFVERGSDNVAGAEVSLPFLVESPLSNAWPQMT